MAGNNGEVLRGIQRSLFVALFTPIGAGRGIADLMDWILSNVHAGPQEVVVQTPFMALAAFSIFHVAFAA